MCFIIFIRGLLQTIIHLATIGQSDLNKYPKMQQFQLQTQIEGHCGNLNITHQLGVGMNKACY